MPLRFEIDARDLRKLDKALAALQQPELRNTTAKALGQAATKVVVPKMREEIGRSVRGKSSPRPAYMKAPKRGTNGPLAKSVRSKQLRKRSAPSGDEMIAIGVGPRAWYKHFVIQGTQPHSTLGPHGTYRMDGKGSKVPTAAQINHPGARPNDIVGRTGRAIAPTVGAALGSEIVGSFAKQMRRRG